ncbi:hypothetical protein GCM10023231_07640 [Olivibacter ginsenosidimutans]|uniref:DUF4440 domain-containing protein n=2 Tax=Olivibacter ginsenosidimutans TaxID=1176537 RepID=A0ABP9AMK5_9SPHI
MLHAQEQPIQTIKKVMKKQEDAWNAGDIPKFMETYWKSDSLLFVGQQGPIYGWQGAFNRYQKAYPDRASMGNLQFQLLRIDALSTSCYFVLGNWKLTRTKGNIGGTFTLLFKEINGQWVIVADHTS